MTYYCCPSVEDRNCVPEVLQNRMFACVKDENGTMAQFVEEFTYLCAKDGADNCSPKSIQQLQKCIGEVGADDEQVSVPKQNLQCMRDNLSSKNLQCLTNKYPSLNSLNASKKTKSESYHVKI